MPVRILQLLQNCRTSHDCAPRRQHDCVVNQWGKMRSRTRCMVCGNVVQNHPALLPSLFLLLSHPPLGLASKRTWEHVIYNLKTHMPVGSVKL
eukprot:3624923-Amphidinium_carterae.1